MAAVPEAGLPGPDRPRPPIKWAGGKGQLLPQFEPLFPRRFDQYVEPFVGGGAVFFHLAPRRAVLIDNNPELINFYRVVRSSLGQLLADLDQHRNEAEYYYQVRACDPGKLDPVARASRFLYLNKTGYNGLWRVNRSGQHNVPFGRYRHPTIADPDNLRRVSAALQGAEIVEADFTAAREFARPGSFVYLDPPYHPVSETARFTSYTAGSFSAADQRRLAVLFEELDAARCLVMLSNSDCPFVRELYHGYSVTEVAARRAINCRGDSRGPVTELVVRNYG